MKRKSKAKKIILSVTALVLVATLGLGGWYYAVNRNTEPVFVYDFSTIGMTEYWGDSRESYGPVTTDGIQTVYVSDTQTVTGILVSEGDTVKKGDVLMTFDTTLSDLALERARLAVEKLKLQLESAQKELRNINSMRPMVIPVDTPDEDENLGTELASDFLISSQAKYDGSTAELPLVCWLRDTKNVDTALLETIRQQAEALQRKNAETADDPLLNAASPTADEGETQPETTAPETTAPETTAPETSPEGGGETPEETTPEETEPEPLVVDSYYVIFKVTSGNMSLGTTKTWQGLYVTRNPETNIFTFRFFDASYVQDYTIAESDRKDTPEIDFGSGYTAAQIAQMRTEQEKTIRDLEFEIKMAEADYKIKQTETSDGNVRAEIDGTVVTVLTEEDAKAMKQPILKVSAGGGFYIEGSVSELEKDTMQLGQEVTVNDWSTGMVYTGVIESIGDFPQTQRNYYGEGNPNASYYPFRVFVDESADLRAGNYVSVSYSSATSQQGIYLQNPFLRTEQGRSYVYVRGADGTLEKRYVTTGKALWGSYTEILSGITQADLLAFPYGKTVKEGAPTQEGDLSDLYNY